jgi:hypothetical protein
MVFRRRGERNARFAADPAGRYVIDFPHDTLVFARLQTGKRDPVN